MVLKKLPTYLVTKWITEGHNWKYPKGHKFPLNISSNSPFSIEYTFKMASREPRRTQVSLKYYRLFALFVIDASHLSIKTPLSMCNDVMHTHDYHIFLKITANVCQLKKKVYPGKTFFLHLQHQCSQVKLFQVNEHSLP